MKFQGTISGTGYGYVYIMSYPNSNKYKIGHAINPTTRARDIGGTLAPETPILEAYFWCSERREDVERKAHELLRAKKSNGEWFNTSLDEAIKTIEEAAVITLVEIKKVFMNDKQGSFATKEERRTWLAEKLKQRQNPFSKN